MGVISTTPALMIRNARPEQNAIWLRVRAMGNGKPAKARTYLLTRMTAAESETHRKMYLADSESFSCEITRLALNTAS